ncbi:CTD nuclear envelope phosphatase [Acrasis kona]|uniref:CTD nuclear envelope phosphatase n=1 Tax=Acrasis kona TaxID=1008807 RepID=A0AAW2ZAZ3_9EUKA
MMNWIRDMIYTLFHAIIYPLLFIYEFIQWNRMTKKRKSLQETTDANSHNDSNNSRFEGDDELQRIRELNRSLTPSILQSIKMKNVAKKKILVLDLDETLIHSTPVEPFPQFKRFYQYRIDVYLDQDECSFYVSERPHLKHFMRKVCEWYEVVIFTASVQSYADPVIDRLECSDKISRRYFRESCANNQGVFIKDLAVLGCDLSRCIIVDNSHISYMWHPENAIPCTSWVADDDNDDELLRLLLLLDALRYMNDVRSVLTLRLKG